VRLAVLGPVLLEGPDGTLQGVPGALARSFLVALALARGSALSTEALIDELWGDVPPRGARAALQTLVSRLRRNSAPGIVASTDSGYRLELESAEIDLRRAGAAAQAIGDRVGRGGDDARDVAGSATEILGLWRGDPGADLDGALAEALADRAASVQRGLRRALADALLDCDDPDAAVRLWADEAAEHPFDEAAVGGRMRALAAAGRPAEAMAVFAEHRTRLADELGADPSADLVRLNADLLRRGGDAGAGAGNARARRIGLRAAATALIGRDDDVATVSGLLREHRLVTVLGAGGLGKTRLAQQVAADVPDDVAVVVVELAPLGDGADIVPTLGALLGIAEVRAGRTLRAPAVADLHGRVVGLLGERQTVLVLDNCEHLVADVAGFAGGLLADLPELRILTTSRAPLAIPGEVVAPLAPLPVEADGAAVRLFTERARAARPGAVLPVDAVRRICDRLDGSPLAIELAAARIRGMGVDEIERRLDDRFALLRGGDRSAPERHRTLLAVIEWSWRLLDAPAQDLLTRLSLFPDGVAVGAVEAVATESDTALDDLAELVEQSLVQLTETPGEPARYRLLETVREFGAAQLRERGTESSVREAMVRWGAAFAADRLLFIADDQARVFHEVERESDNLIGLLRWALQSGDTDAVARLFAAVGSYWTVRGALNEVFGLSVDVVGALAAQQPREPVRSATLLSLVIASAPAVFLDRRTAARGIPAVRRIVRDGPTGNGLLDAQAQLLVHVGRPHRSWELLAAYRDDPDQRVAAFALAISAPLTENSGELEVALGYAKRAEALAGRNEDLWTAGTAAVSMTQLLTQLGRYREALDVAETARGRLERFGADDDLAELGWGVGLAAAASGEVDRARRMAVDLDGHRDNRGGFDDDRAQMGALAFAVRAECARAEGDLDAAVAEYERGREFVDAYRKQSPHWYLMVCAAAIAVADERATHSAPDATSADQRESRLQTARSERDVARRARVGALVLLRINPWWLDMPVVGTGIVGVIVWGVASGRVAPADLVALWGQSVRLGARQDFAVLERTRLRAIVAEVTGEQALLDAETASAGQSRDEAVGVSRALLERVVYAFRM
jgi:predicted ATPase/DNA-binding SARP family transcriptional activator